MAADGSGRNDVVYGPCDCEGELGLGGTWTCEIFVLVLVARVERNFVSLFSAPLAVDGEVVACWFVDTEGIDDVWVETRDMRGMVLLPLSMVVPGTRVRTASTRLIKPSMPSISISAIVP